VDHRLYTTPPRAHNKPAGHGTTAFPCQRVRLVAFDALVDVSHAGCRQVAVSVGPCGPVLVVMKCYLCDAVMPDGHTQWTCKLHKYFCRLYLPEGHPLRPSRADVSCTDSSCSHRRTCSTCKQPGHQHDTLAPHSGGNQITKAGKILRLPDAGPLKGRDFVCALMDDNRARAHAAGKRTGYVARHEERKATASSSGVLQGNVYQSKSTSADTLAHMQDAGLRASTLEATNKRCHDLAVIHRASGMTPVGAAVAAARGVGQHSNLSGSGP